MGGPPRETAGTLLDKSLMRACLDKLSMHFSGLSARTDEEVMSPEPRAIHHEPLGAGEAYEFAASEESVLKCVEPHLLRLNSRSMKKKTEPLTVTERRSLYNLVKQRQSERGGSENDTLSALTNEALNSALTSRSSQSYLLILFIRLLEYVMAHQESFVEWNKETLKYRHYLGCHRQKKYQEIHRTSDLDLDSDSDSDLSFEHAMKKDKDASPKIFHDIWDEIRNKERIRNEKEHQKEVLTSEVEWLNFLIQRSPGSAINDMAAAVMHELERGSIPPLSENVVRKLGAFFTVMGAQLRSTVIKKIPDTFPEHGKTEWLPYRSRDFMRAAWTIARRLLMGTQTKYAAVTLVPEMELHFPTSRFGPSLTVWHAIRSLVVELGASPQEVNVYVQAQAADWESSNLFYTIFGAHTAVEAFMTMGHAVGAGHDADFAQTMIIRQILEYHRGQIGKRLLDSALSSASDLATSCLDAASKPDKDGGSLAALM